ncbi:MAG TPA: cytochrome c [Methyloceanibacter sp.]|nr:cytochrome c [Methyloceanibacter sp.]
MLAGFGVRRGRGLAALLGAGLLLGIWVSEAEAVQKGLADKGEVLVKENCGRCHAVGREGDSPHHDAPPFRTLSAHYPVTDLAESLAEGIVSGHPDMPVFVFDPQDIAAIIEYLELIQDAPPPVEEPVEPEN